MNAIIGSKSTLMVAAKAAQLVGMLTRSMTSSLTQF